MRIAAHIVVQGADRAASFYREAFGAEELTRIPTPDGRLMSVQLRLGETVLHIADEFPELGVFAPPSIGETAVVLGLEVNDAELVFARAVAAGAQARQPLQEMFWGELQGQLDDPFGHRWNVSQHFAMWRTRRSWPQPPAAFADMQHRAVDRIRSCALALSRAQMMLAAKRAGFSTSLIRQASLATRRRVGAYE